MIGTHALDQAVGIRVTWKTCVRSASTPSARKPSAREPGELGDDRGMGGGVDGRAAR